jgi:hypothetical protein
VLAREKDTLCVEEVAARNSESASSICMVVQEKEKEAVCVCASEKGREGEVLVVFGRLFSREKDTLCVKT